MTATRASADVVAALRRVGIIPVVRAPSADVAVRVAETLFEAGIPVAEITMTVPDAFAVIGTVARRFAGRMLVAAGTVTDAEAARRAIDAGAEVVVTPCLVPEVIAAARAAGITVIAGALTPSEVFQAAGAGADLVKVFPAQSVGGAAYIRALRAPFPAIPLVPTGGVRLETVGDFLDAGAAALGVGGELVRRDALERGDYDAIGALARRFVRAVGAARGA